MSSSRERHSNSKCMLIQAMLIFSFRLFYFFIFIMDSENIHMEWWKKSISFLKKVITQQNNVLEKKTCIKQD